MKRSAIKRGKPLQRHRVRWRVRRAPMPQSVAEAVRARAGSSCEACGGYLFANESALHHRKARSAGGKDTLANLMQVHGDTYGGINCHNVSEYSIHQNPDRSERLGHIVKSGQDETAIPVQVCSTLFWLRA